MRIGRTILIFIAAASIGFAPGFSRAQDKADTSKPLPIKEQKPPKPVTFQGFVLSSNVQSITLRSRTDEKVIRTFTYSAELQGKMQEINGRGGFQYGDKVEVVADAGSTVAIRIKGKPSKPL